MGKSRLRSSSAPLADEVVDVRLDCVLKVLAQPARSPQRAAAIEGAMRTCNVGRNMVYSWLKSYQEYGRAGLVRKARTDKGKPRVLGLDTDEAARLCRAWVQFASDPRYTGKSISHIAAEWQSLQPDRTLPAEVTLRRWSKAAALAETREREAAARQAQIVLGDGSSPEEQSASDPIEAVCGDLGAPLLRLFLAVIMADMPERPAYRAPLTAYVTGQPTPTSASASPFAAYSRWLAMDLPGLSALQSQFQRIDIGQRDTIGRFFVILAATTGGLTKRRSQALSRVFEALSLPRSSLQQHLDALTGSSEQATEPIIAGLDAAHSQLLRDVAAHPRLTRAAFGELCDALGLLPDGALDRLNDAALDAVDDVLCEADDEELMIDHEVIKGMLPC